MTSSVDDQVVAITGAARGIGRATAEAFLRAGARVAIGDIDQDLAAATARSLAATTGGRVEGLFVDVTDRRSFEAFLDTAEALLGPLDVLVNNAGIMPTGLYADESDVMTDRMIDINLRGVLHGSKLARARMDGRGGHIVNLASLAGVSGYPGLATYCATKHAVLGFSDAFGREVAGSGIHVTAILPGIVNTELSAGNSTPAWLRPLATVEPEDVALAIVAVIGTDKSRVTVPRPLGTMLKTLSVLPGFLRRPAERLGHFDTAFAVTDPQSREAYHQRITGID